MPIIATSIAVANRLIKNSAPSLAAV